ncbi:hypothetical protein CC80DRAFT_210103 [Byssothecium circinans]|uniref:Uncharacterized protein n=1 Tax=Byssothecium circinans TaxID=147558 RepID=A0A6A5TEU5_9PLEO|nr:hypothetical protein CC80DRAFT_210103 [Byssothecium circinans]
MLTTSSHQQLRARAATRRSTNRCPSTCENICKAPPDFRHIAAQPSAHPRLSRTTIIHAYVHAYTPMPKTYTKESPGYQ